MNRRGFLAAAIGAALTPQELIQPQPWYKRVTYGTLRMQTAGPLSEAEIRRIGALYTQHLARSMIETKETLVANILNAYG